MEENTETTFWKGSSSQWLNIGHFGAALLAAVGIVIVGVLFSPAFIALLFPLGWIFWRYLVVRTQTFELTNERLRISTGVINQKIDEGVEFGQKFIAILASSTHLQIRAVVDVRVDDALDYKYRT